MFRAGRCAVLLLLLGFASAQSGSVPVSPSTIVQTVRAQMGDIIAVGVNALAMGVTVAAVWWLARRYLRG